MAYYDKSTILSAFDLLRFPLIVAVVFIHNYPEGDGFQIQSLILGGDNLSFIDILNIISVAISHVCAYIAVPTFFLISGFLFFFNVKEKFSYQTYGSKLKRRIKSLLVPYLCWNLIAFLAILTLKVLGVLVKGNSSSGIVQFISDGNFVSYFWNSAQWSPDRQNVFNVPCPMTAPIDVPLWYMRNLMTVCLFSPLVYFLLKLSKYTIALFLLLYLFNFELPISGFSIQTFAMFSLGAFSAIHGLTLFEPVNKCTDILLSLITLALFCDLVMTDGSESLPHHVCMASFTIIGTVLTVKLALHLASHKQCVCQNGLSRLLCESSFFIYALHTILLLDLTRKAIEMLFGFNEDVKRLMLYFISPFGCITICVLIYCFMAKYCKSALAVLMGGRVNN